MKGIALTEDDRVRGAIIERLMCDLEVDLAVVGRGGDDRFADEIESLRLLEDDGLLVIDGRRLRVTPEGRPFTRLVAASFDAHLAKSKARHSLAV